MQVLATRTAPRRSWIVAVSSDVGWRWVVLGFVGTTLLSLTGPALLSHFDGVHLRWWFGLPASAVGVPVQQVAADAGLAAVLVAWVAVGARLRAGSGSRPSLLGVPAIAWALPLVVGPPMFSRDMYSYIAQARLSAVGLSPYTNGPLALIGSPGGRTFVDAVSPVWRNTVAPYGPLFLWSATRLLDVAGRDLMTAALMVRLPALLGLVLTFIFLPRLARSNGVDARVALWFGVLSPLTMFDLLSAGHNDALMIGLLVAALCVATEASTTKWCVPAAISLAAAAAMVKLPAAAVCLILAVTWVKGRPAGEHVVRRSIVSATVAVATAVAFSVATGIGFGWAKPSVLLTPTGGFIASTPASAFGVVEAVALRLVGIHVSTGSAQHFTWYLLEIGAVALCVTLVIRCRGESLVSTSASVMLLAAVAAPALWPWYLTWGLVVLAATAAVKASSGVLTVGVLISAVALGPDGEVLPPLSLSWLFAALWLGVGLYVLLARRRQKLLRKAVGQAAGTVNGGTVVEGTVICDPPPNPPLDDDPEATGFPAPFVRTSSTSKVPEL